MDSVTPPPETYTYLPYQPPPPKPPPDPKRRRALIAVTVGWMVVLAGTGIWYSFHGSPSIRDQTTIERSAPVVIEAVQNVVRAAGPSVVPAVSGFDKIGDCEVTPVRNGARYQRVVSLYTTPGTEAALIDRLGSGLPARYKAAVSHSPGGALHTITADAGYYVAVVGTVTVPGLVTVRVATGCRTTGHLPAPDPTADPGDNPLGVSGQWYVHALPCGLRTVEVSGAARQPLGTLPKDGAVVATGDVYAVPAGRAARLDAGVVTWSLTTGRCG